MNLTKREFEIMGLLTPLEKGRPRTVWASEKLGISRPNLQNYISRLQKKGLVLQTPEGRAACREFLASYTHPTQGPLNARQLAILKRYAMGESYRDIAEALTAENKAHPNPKKRKAVQISSVIQAVCNCMAAIGRRGSSGGDRVASAHRWLTQNGHLTEPLPPGHKNPRICIDYGTVGSRQLFNVYGLYEEGELVYIGATPYPWERTMAHRDYYPKYTVMKLLHGGPNAEAIWQLMDEEIARHKPRDNRPDFTAYRNGASHAMPPRAFDPMDPANY